MLETVYQESDQRHLFFVHASDPSSLDKTYLHIARRIGPEYLLKGFQGKELQEIWRNESSEDKI